MSIEDDGLQPMSPGSDEEAWFYRCTVEDEPDGGVPCPDEPMTTVAREPVAVPARRPRPRLLLARGD